MNRDRVGTKDQVYYGNAEITSGGLRKSDLFKCSRDGKIKSLHASNAQKRNYRSNRQIQETLKRNSFKSNDDKSGYNPYEVIRLPNEKKISNGRRKAPTTNSNWTLKLPSYMKSRINIPKKKNSAKAIKLPNYLNPQ